MFVDPRDRKMARWIAFAIIGALAIVAMMLFFAANAGAHSWYPDDCCHGRDCYHAPPGEVEWTPAGWHVIPTGEIIAVDDKRIRVGPESGGIHRCTHYGQPLSPTICLFIPGADG